MFIPMWVIYVVGGLVIAHMWSLHSQRNSRLGKALAESTAQLEECQQELEECQQELEDTRSYEDDEPDGRMNP